MSSAVKSSAHQPSIPPRIYYRFQPSICHRYPSYLSSILFCMYQREKQKMSILHVPPSICYRLLPVSTIDSFPHLPSILSSICHRYLLLSIIDFSLHLPSITPLIYHRFLPLFFIVSFVLYAGTSTKYLRSSFWGGSYFTYLPKVQRL